MAYVPVSQRQKKSSSSRYVPVKDRKPSVLPSSSVLPSTTPAPKPGLSLDIPGAVKRSILGTVSGNPVVAAAVDRSGILSQAKDTVRGLFGKKPTVARTPSFDETPAGVFVNTEKEVPGEVLKQIVQPTMRAYAGVGNAINQANPLRLLGYKPPAPIKPTTPLEKFIYGDEKPLTATRSGRELALQNPDAPIQSAAGKAIYPALGVLSGAADLIPGGSEVPAAVRSLSKEARAFLAAEKDSGVIARFLKDKIPSLSDETVQKIAPRIAAAGDEKTAIRELSAGIPKEAKGKYVPVAERRAASADIPEHLKPLAEEAKKYKSAEEFVGSGTKSFDDLPDYAKNSLAQEARAQNLSGIPYKDSRFVEVSLPISEVQKMSPDTFANTFTKRGSVTKGPIVFDDSGKLIDGNNRAREAFDRGDTSIRAFVEVPRTEELTDFYNHIKNGATQTKRPNIKLEQMAVDARNFEDFSRRAGVSEDVLNSTARAKGYKDAKEFFNETHANPPERIKDNTAPRYSPTEEESITRSLEQTLERSGKLSLDEALPLPKRDLSKFQAELEESKKILEEAKLQRDIGRDFVPDMPGKVFAKYESSKFPGELPEVRPLTRYEKSGSKGLPTKDRRGEFEKRGDRIAMDNGFQNLDDAIKAFSDYREATIRQKEAEQLVSKRVKDYRDRKAVFDEVVRFVKQEGAARREKVKMVQDFFKFDNKEMKDLLRKERDVRLMTDGEFEDFMKRLAGQAANRFMKNRDLNELKATIFEKEFVKLDNLRKVMKFPTIEKMTPKQLQEFNATLQEFEKGDEFLTVRQLETIKNTDLDGIYTMREAREQLVKEVNADRVRKGMEPITVDDLRSIKTGEFDKYLYDVALANKHPLFDFMVHQTHELMLGAELKSFEERESIDKLISAARKSRKRNILEHLIPTDKRIFDWLEATDADKLTMAEDMTQEELKAASAIRDWYSKARDYLVTQGTLDRYRTNYITHVRRGFLESWLEGARTFKPDVSGAKQPGAIRKGWEGLRAALKEVFQQYKQDEAYFNIMNEKTGDVLPLEKFFQFSMKRSGELQPTKNVARAFLKYAETFEKKRALDALIPKMDIFIHALAPQKRTPHGLEFDDSLKRFWKEWMNTKKGRVVDTKVVKPGGKLDWGLRTGVALTRILDLGLNIPVALASNVGAQISAYRGLGEKAFALSKAREFTKEGRALIKKYTPLIGESTISKIRSTDSNISSNVVAAIFSLFSEADRAARKSFFLGSLTPEEFKSGEISAKRLADIRLAMGRHMPVENFESVMGKTSLGKAGTQYRSWAVPLAYSTLDDVGKMLKAVNGYVRKGDKAGFQKWLKSPEAGELLRTTLISSVAIWGAYGLSHESTKNKSFLEKLAIKSAQDSLSLVGSLNPESWTNAPRLLSFLHDLASGVVRTVTLDTDKKGNLTGPAKVGSTVTPALVRQFEKTVEPTKKKSNPSNLPELPTVPLPELPTLPTTP